MRSVGLLSHSQFVFVPNKFRVIFFKPAAAHTHPKHGTLLEVSVDKHLYPLSACIHSRVSQNWPPGLALEELRIRFPRVISHRLRERVSGLRLMWSCILETTNSLALVPSLVHYFHKRTPKAMISHARTAGLALVVLGYAARRAAAVDVSTCPELLDGISQASTPTTITIIKSFECSTTIVVEAGQEITVTGGGETITISSTFTSEATTESSLFSNEGTLIIESLTVDEVTLDEEATKLGVRAIYNTGVLVVRSSTFQRLSIRGEVDIRIKRGGVVSNG